MEVTDMSKLSEPLSVKDIDFRVQSVNKGGYATILAYKSARVDMHRLDEVCGPLGWKRGHLNNNTNCIVSIYDDKRNQWVSKEDVGTESQAEAKKGLASDSFKRACFNWGIGRELYDYPIISVKLKENEISNGKASWGFKLKEWTWLTQFDKGVLNFIAAKDEKGIVRFKYGTYDKARALIEEQSAGGLKESTDTVEATPIVEEGKPEMILKKPHEPVPVEQEKQAPVEVDEAQEERNALSLLYKDIYGKRPSSAMKLENLKAKVEEGQKPKEESKPAYVAPEVTEEEEVNLGVFESLMAEDVALIDGFTDSEAFKVWAKKTFTKWEGIVSTEDIEEFKDLCRKQFEKLK